MYCISLYSGESSGRPFSTVVLNGGIVNNQYERAKWAFSFISISVPGREQLVARNHVIAIFYRILHA